MNTNSPTTLPCAGCNCYLGDSRAKRGYSRTVRRETRQLALEVTHAEL